MVAHLKKPTGCEGFQEIEDFLNGSHIRYALTKNPTIYVSLIEKFWQTATVRTVDNGEQEINATVDGKEFTITKTSVRRHLQLADADGISVLPNTKIFNQLTLMGYVLTDDKLTFQKAKEGKGSGNSSEPQPPPSTTKPTHEEPIPNIESSSPQKTQSPRQALNKDTELPQTSVPIPYVPDEAIHQERGDSVERAATTATSLEAVQDNGGLRRQETMGGASVQTRFKRASKLSYDSPLRRGSTPQSDKDSMTLQELTDLCTRLSDRVLALETDLKQTKKGRMIEEIDQDVEVTLVTPTKVSSQEDQPKDQLGVLSTAKVLTDAARVHTYSRRRRAVSTGSGRVSTASRIVRTAEESQRIARDAEIAQRLQEEIDAAEKQRMAQVHQAAQGFTEDEWEDIRARVEADEELTQKLQAEERDKYSEVDQARMLVDLINQRKRYFAAQKAEAKRNKPMTQAQQRTYMSNYIKHMGSHTLQQLKKLSFDEVKELFETTMKRVNTFTPMESDDTVLKVVAGSSKRDAKQELNQESSKRQKIGEGLEPAEESRDELSQEQLQQLMIIVPEEGMNVEALQTKYPIIDWEVYTEDSRKDDLVKLWSLVHERFNSTEPTKHKETELWVELKRLFEPDDNVFYGSFKDYPLTRALMTLMLSNQLQVDKYSVMVDELLRKIFILANRPR
ncbi:hypothetical protein Tco_0502414 [Tanacetum coccineum]